MRGRRREERSAQWALWLAGAAMVALLSGALRHGDASTAPPVAVSAASTAPLAVP
jgi:hypothetical protein